MEVPQPTLIMICWNVLSRNLLLVFVAVLFGAGAVSAGSTPQTVSPGDPEEVTLVEARCPTFSWAAVDGAEGYELVVYPAESPFGDTEPVLMQTLQGGVTAWTPSMDRCLQRNGRYAWSVGAKGPEGVTEWSAAALFQVAAGLSELEYGQVVKAVERFLATRPAGAGLDDSEDQALREAEAAAGTRATFPPAWNTQILVENGHIAVRRDGRGFVQLDTRDGFPPQPYQCDELRMTGAMVLRSGSPGRLYICATDGVTVGWSLINLH